MARDRFRTELLRFFEAEEVREALFLASPVLEDAFRRDPQASDSGKRRRLDAALTKYLVRMAGRSTPFGLFAGISVGTIGEKTELRIGPRTGYGRTTRIDMGYLAMLVDGLMRDPVVRDAVHYRPNSTLYVLGGRARYAEHRPGDRARSYFLVSAEMDDALSSTLERARNGVSRGELIRALVDDGFEAEEATPYIDELITNQALVPELGPALTGGDPMADLADQLEKLTGQEPMAGVLRSVGQRLEALDRSGLGHEPEAYRTIATMVDSLPADANIERLFQVDMTKPHETLTLSESLLSDMLEVAGFLARFFGAQTDPMEDFRRAFADRYAEREVPLLEVLDEECGIGFRSSRGVTADASPLLAGIPFAAAPGEERIRWGPVQDLLLRRLMETRAEPESPLVFTTNDVAGSQLAIVLPPAFSIMAELLPDDGKAGSPKFLWQGLSGPSGARLLGRFCHTSPDLLTCVCQHLRAEEELEPDKIYCEIAHLPEGRMGNVIARPLLREHEIVFLARSGSQTDKQIPLTDLRVSMRGSRVVLRSFALGREIVPRLANAHNFRRGIGVYRFLAALQDQGYTNYLGWQWGPFERLPYLPRVVFRNAILSPARWLVDRTATAAAKGAREDEAVVRFNDWAEQHRLPRWVGLRESDNVLPVDRENPMSLEAMLDATHGQTQFTLVEMPGFETHGVVSGAEGTFANEVVVPFVRRVPVQTDADAVEAVPTHAFDTTIAKNFLPGSEWLFVRFHTVPGFADALMTRTLGPFVRKLVQEGLALNWFFIRYADPDFHIRLRIRCNTAETTSVLLPRIRSIAEELVGRGLVTKIAYDTYDREIARYGGPAGIDLCESIFGIDSEAAVDLVDCTPHDEGADVRWQLTLCGMDALLNDLGFDLGQRYLLSTKMAENYAREFNLGSARHQVQDKFRRERRVLMSLMNGSKSELADLQPGLAILDRRSDRLEPTAMELRLRSEAGRLAAPLSGIAGNLLHMHANRMLPTAARAQEAILYQFLENLYDSELSRSGRRKRDRHG